MATEKTDVVIGASPTGLLLIVIALDPAAAWFDGEFERWNQVARRCGDERRVAATVHP
jgi:hypothetical protein